MSKLKNLLLLLVGDDPTNDQIQSLTDVLADILERDVQIGKYDCAKFNKRRSLLEILANNDFPIATLVTFIESQQ